jgi:hypothetical protein
VHLGDCIDGLCPKTESEASMSAVVNTFKKYKGHIYHMLGNHCLYNLPRAVLNEQLGISKCSQFAASDHAIESIALTMQYCGRRLLVAYKLLVHDVTAQPARPASCWRSCHQSSYRDSHCSLLLSCDSRFGSHASCLFEHGNSHINLNCVLLLHIKCHANLMLYTAYHAIMLLCYQ